MSCIQCNKLLSPGKVPVHVPINVPFDDIDQNVDKSSIQAKEEFITAINRGGLTKPSDYIYVCSVHSSALCSYIFSQEDLKKSLFSTEKPRDTFVHSYMHIIGSDENASQLAEVQCTNGHKHKFLSRVAFTMFNISAKNYGSSLNDSIRKSKVSKQNQGNTKTVKISKATRKIKKQQSN